MKYLQNKHSHKPISTDWKEWRYLINHFYIENKFEIYLIVLNFIILFNLSIIFKNGHKKSTIWCNFKRENLRITTKKASFSLQKNGRGERIRTFGLMVPNHARYQAAPHPDVLTTIYNIPALKLFVKSFLKVFLIFVRFA